MPVNMAPKRRIMDLFQPTAKAQKTATTSSPAQRVSPQAYINARKEEEENIASESSSSIDSLKPFARLSRYECPYKEVGQCDNKTYVFSTFKQLTSHVNKGHANDAILSPVSDSPFRDGTKKFPVRTLAARCLNLHEGCHSRSKMHPASPDWYSLSMEGLQRLRQNLFKY
jgi:hypothetical protein